MSIKNNFLFCNQSDPKIMQNFIAQLREVGGWDSPLDKLFEWDVVWEQYQKLGNS